MTLLLGVLLIPFLFYVPGYIWGRLVQRYADTLARQYEYVLFSSLITSWLAFTLAEFGWLSMPLLVLLVAVVCALGLLLGRRFTPVPHPVTSMPPRWELFIYAGVLLLFALIVSRPFETVLGGRDAGVYPNTGYAIARTGAIVQYEASVADIGRNLSASDPTVQAAAQQAYSNFLGVQGRQRFIATRFTQPGFFINDGEVVNGRVVPQYFHLYAVWIAVWTLLFGLHGGLVATGFLGLLAVWSIALVVRLMLSGRRGTIAGIIALLMIALNPLQIWFSRYTTSEILAQMLLWAGLAMWVQFMNLTPDQRRGRLGLWYGGLTGAAIGQLILTRIDFFWGVGPLLLLLVWVFVRRQWHRGYAAMALTLGLNLIHGLLHILLIARSYFFDTSFAKMQETSALISRLARPFYTPLLQEVWVTNNRSAEYYFNTPRLVTEIILLCCVIIMLLALRRWPLLLTRMLHYADQGRRPVAFLLALGLLISAFYAYFLRPQMITTAMLTDPVQHSLAWQSYIGAPITVPDSEAGQTQRAVVLANMMRLGWYLSPLGIILGVAGLAGWLLRDFNQRTWLVLLVAISYGAFYIRDTYGTAEQTYIYIARRFLSGAVPACVLGIAWLAAAMLLDQRRWLRGIGATCVVGLCTFYVATGWRAVRHVEYAGALTSIAALAEQIEDDAVVIMRGGDRDAPSNIATPLRYAFNKDVWVAWSENPLLYRIFLADQVRLWQAQERPVYLLLGVNGAALTLPGFELQDQGLFDLQLAEWQQLQNQKPFTAGSIRFTYRLYKLEPTANKPSQAEQPLNLTDYQWQLRGFYPLEQDRTGLAYAWTTAGATLLLPPQATTSILELELGLGAALPPSLKNTPAAVCPELQPLAPQPAAIQLACVEVQTLEPHIYTWQLPPLSEQAERWLLTLHTRTWIPNNHKTEYSTPPNDGRELGIQWTGGRILPHQ